MLMLFAERMYSAAEKLEYRGPDRGPYLPGPIHRVHGVAVSELAYACGHNPFLVAVRAENCQSIGSEGLEWEELGPVSFGMALRFARLRGLPACRQGSPTSSLPMDAGTGIGKGSVRLGLVSFERASGTSGEPNAASAEREACRESHCADVRPELVMMGSGVRVPAAWGRGDLSASRVTVRALHSARCCASSRTRVSGPRAACTGRARQRAPPAAVPCVHRRLAAPRPDRPQRTFHPGGWPVPAAVSGQGPRAGSGRRSSSASATSSSPGARNGSPSMNPWRYAQISRAFRSARIVQPLWPVSLRLA